MAFDTTQLFLFERNVDIPTVTSVSRDDRSHTQVDRNRSRRCLIDEQKSVTGVADPRHLSSPLTSNFDHSDA